MRAYRSLGESVKVIRFADAMNTTDNQPPQASGPKKPGRTPLPDNERREHGIRVRFSNLELAPLARQANAAGIPLATFIREVATGKRPNTNRVRRV